MIAMKNTNSEKKMYVLIFFLLHMPMLNWMFNSSSRFIFCDEMFSSEEVCMDALILYDPPLKRGRGPSFEKKTEIFLTFR